MIKSARKFAADCGKDGAAWETDVREKVRAGLAMAAVIPSFEERQAIFESWWGAWAEHEEAAA